MTSFDKGLEEKKHHMATVKFNDKAGLHLLQSLVDYWVSAKRMKILKQCKWGKP